MGTHSLEMASGETSQSTESIRPSERYSLPGDGIRRYKSGHGKHATERGALTNWRRHQEGQVRTQKMRLSEGHSLPGDGIRRDKSGHGKNLTERGVLTRSEEHTSELQSP